VIFGIPLLISLALGVVGAPPGGCALLFLSLCVLFWRILGDPKDPNEADHPDPQNGKSSKVGALP
jgi:hypothetical protein